jgi:hypothetical protein
MLTELLLTAGSQQLRWNVVGVDSSGQIDLDRLSVHLFTVDFGTSRGGFDAPLGPTEIGRLYAFLKPFAEKLPQAARAERRLRIVEQDYAVEEILRLLPSLDAVSLGRVIASINSPEKLDWLAKHLSLLEREELEASLRHSHRSDALRRLRTLVDEDVRDGGDVVELCERDDGLAAFQAGKPETVFQRWFELNSWVLGREYVRRHPLRVIGLDSEADLIMETVDGFLDLVELKRPVTKVLTFRQGRHPVGEFFYAHSELSMAIGQCLRYLKDMEDLRHQLQEQYRAQVVTPRVYLIIGRSSRARTQEMEALRRLAASHHRIEILTYDQILDMGNQLLGGGAEA